MLSVENCIALYNKIDTSERISLKGSSFFELPWASLSLLQLFQASSSHSKASSSLYKLFHIQQASPLFFKLPQAFSSFFKPFQASSSIFKLLQVFLSPILLVQPFASFFKLSKAHSSFDAPLWRGKQEWDNYGIRFLLRCQF